jgi:hypothetical protein
MIWRILYIALVAVVLEVEAVAVSGYENDSDSDFVQIDFHLRRRRHFLQQYSCFPPRTKGGLLSHKQGGFIHQFDVLA